MAIWIKNNLKSPLTKKQDKGHLGTYIFWHILGAIYGHTFFGIIPIKTKELKHLLEFFLIVLKNIFSF